MGNMFLAVFLWLVSVPVCLLAVCRFRQKKSCSRYCHGSGNIHVMAANFPKLIIPSVKIAESAVAWLECRQSWKSSNAA